MRKVLNVKKKPARFFIHQLIHIQEMLEKLSDDKQLRRLTELSPENFLINVVFILLYSSFSVIHKFAYRHA